MSEEMETSELDDGRITFERAREAPNAAQKDPVCGMDVDTAEAVGSREYRGTTYYFCSPTCRESFDADPTSYVG